jgi:deazaflavin-dependent oxidoreductase (nitroreductase family)
VNDPRDAVLAASRDEDFCYLTTIGRVSGQPHEIEIWFAVAGHTLYLLAGAGQRSDWVRNLMAHPIVRVRLRDDTFDAHGRVIEPSTMEDERARQLVFDKYQPRYDGDLVEWRARSLPVAIDL